MRGSSDDGSRCRLLVTAYYLPAIAIGSAESKAGDGHSSFCIFKVGDFLSFETVLGHASFKLGEYRYMNRN